MPSLSFSTRMEGCRARRRGAFRTVSTEKRVFRHLHIHRTIFRDKKSRKYFSSKTPQFRLHTLDSFTQGSSACRIVHNGATGHFATGKVFVVWKKVFNILVNIYFNIEPQTFCTLPAQILGHDMHCIIALPSASSKPQREHFSFRTMLSPWIQYTHQ